MSTLLETRTQFIDLSGRYDLATDPAGSDYTDNGADFYLKAGQRMLDRKFSTPKDTARLWKTVPTGSYHVMFQDARAILNVWINNSTDRVELVKKDYVWLKNQFPSLIASTDQNDPLYYAPAFIRTVDNADMNNTGVFFNSVVTNSDALNGIVFFPPTDEAFDVEVRGLFYSDWPTSDTGTSYWMQLHPMVSVWAGLYMLEISNRNTAGGNDWMNAIDRETIGIDMDTVEEELAQDTVLQMEG